VPAALPGGARLASQPARHHCRLQAQGPRGNWIQVPSSFLVQGTFLNFFSGLDCGDVMGCVS
jgi:hypothetical protein